MRTTAEHGNLQAKRCDEHDFSILSRWFRVYKNVPGKLLVCLVVKMKKFFFFFKKTSFSVYYCTDYTDVFQSSSTCMLPCRLRSYVWYKRRSTVRLTSVFCVATFVILHAMKTRVECHPLRPVCSFAKPGIILFFIFLFWFFVCLSIHNSEIDA